MSWFSCDVNPINRLRDAQMVLKYKVLLLLSKPIEFSCSFEQLIILLKGGISTIPPLQDYR